MRRDWYGRYLGSAALERERRRLWSRVWLLAAHTSEVAEPGEYTSYEVLDASVLIVRGDDDVLRAFHNVCAHRGARLCEGRGGPASALRCAYHGWTYALDGSLRDVPGSSSFANLDRADRGLRPLPCACWAGFVWISLDASIPPLEDFLGAVPALVEPWKLHICQRVVNVSAALACNWKLSVDVHNESYHLSSLHPEFRVGRAETELLGPHAHLRVSGGDLPGVNHLVYLFPNVQLNVHDDHFMLFRHRPDPRDPGRCTFDQQVFQRDAASPRADVPEPVSPEDPRIGPVTAADLRMAERLQRGAGNRGLPGPIFSAQEMAVANMYASLDRYLGDD